MSVSPRHRKAVKRLTQTLQIMHGLKRIPAPLPRPGSEAYKTSPSAPPKVAGDRQRAYAEATKYRLDKETVAFFSSPFSLEARQ